VDVATEQGITRRHISDEEILQRLLYPMVNEGAKILEEKIAIRASDIDVIWVYGYGWPVYRGGPMFWASQIGLPKVRDKMLEFQKATGDAFWDAGAAAQAPGRRGQGVRERMSAAAISRSRRLPSWPA
jgi:3-hydroxyacyl-CoA dehydrogenase